MRRPSAMGGGATYSVPVLRRTPGGPHLPPSPLPLPRWGRGRGRARPHLPPSPLPLPHGERKGGRGGAGAKAWWPVHAMVACWERGPLARILMDGTGVHWLQRWYCGARLACPHLPPSPLPLPRWGRGRGRARPHLPPSPLPHPHGERKGEGAAFPSPSPLHRFARRSACSFPHR